MQSLRTCWEEADPGADPSGAGRQPELPREPRWVSPCTVAAGWGALAKPAWGEMSPGGRRRGSQGGDGMRGTPRLPLGQSSCAAEGAGPQGQAESPGVHSLRQKCWPESPKPQPFGMAARGPLPCRTARSPTLGAPLPWELARAAAAPSGRNAEVNGGSGVGRPNVEGAGWEDPCLFRLGRSGERSKPRGL